MALDAAGPEGYSPPSGVNSQRVPRCDESILGMKSDEQIAQSPSRSTEFYEGERVAGTPFRVVAQIGQGGMGSVYEVEHVELGKRFVLKALLDQFSQRQDLVQRLRNEWKSLGRLEHPNIVSVFHAGVAANGVPFYVMERLIGETVAGALQRLGRLNLLDALRIAAEVLEGLQAAHEINIVHRDVKPPNIFLTRHGAVKLLDFGIAKLTDGAANLDLTGRGIAIGTPRYMSPEQAAGERVDGRADLYAVGLVLFEMLSGCGPFDGCESHEVFLAHLTRQPPSLKSLVDSIPDEVEAFIATLLAKRAADRPASAGAAAATLRSMLRTYRGQGAQPDPLAHELPGASAPLMRDSYLPPSLPPPAEYLAVASVPEDEAGFAGGQVSGNGLGQNWALAGQRMSPLAVNFGAAPGAQAEAGPTVAPTSTPSPPSGGGPFDTFGGRYEPTPGPLSNSAPPGSFDPSVLRPRDVRVRHLAALSFVVVGAAGVAGWLARAPVPTSRAVPPEMAPLAAAAAYVPEPESRPSAATAKDAPQPGAADQTSAQSKAASGKGAGDIPRVKAKRPAPVRGEVRTARRPASSALGSAELGSSSPSQEESRTPSERASAQPQASALGSGVRSTPVSFGRERVAPRSAASEAANRLPRLPSSGLPGVD